MLKKPQATAASQRPLWARVLDVVADVLVGVGTAVALLMMLAAVAVLVGVAGSGLGEWVLDTSVALLGPIESLVDSLLTIEDDRLMLAVVPEVSGPSCGTRPGYLPERRDHGR